MPTGRECDVRGSTVREMWAGAVFASAIVTTACGTSPAAELDSERTSEPQIGRADAGGPQDAGDPDADAGCRLYDCLGPRDAHDHDHDHDPWPPGDVSPRTTRLRATCELMFEDGAAATTAPSLEEAGDHVIGASQTAYEVEVPAGESVFLTVNVAKAHTNTRFYIAPGSGLAALHDLAADLVVFTFSRGLPSTQCPETFDEVHLWHVHAAGDYVLEFEAGEARTARFLVEGSDSDHSDPPDAGDAGDAGD
jgi:hypothetical protein